MYTIICFVLSWTDGVIKIIFITKEFFKGLNWIMMPNNKAEILKYFFFIIMAK